ncbi:MAG TPA: YcbK family protein [Vicinamibacterales bacterium]|nr:YcbK family protein [Vicinamibacterales bacterium]
MHETTHLSRRNFCALGAMTAVSMLLPRDVCAAVSSSDPDKQLSFFHTHTGERLKVEYCCDGEYQRAALSQINHLLRDFRTNEIRAIDVRLLNLLHGLTRELQTVDPYHVISGYRSPQTNMMLRTRGGAHTGVASRSLHMIGKAIDIRVPDVPLEELHKAAVSLKKGGVGIYPASNFVHLDVGRVRYWAGK